MTIELKRGRYTNELTQFRYDVFLEVEPERDSPPSRIRYDWQRDGLDEAKLVGLLEASDREEILVTDLPNARLWREARLRILTSDRSNPTVEQMRRRLEDAAAEGVDPERLFDLADSAERTLRLEWAASGDPTLMDACFGAPGRSRVASTVPSETTGTDIEWVKSSGDGSKYGLKKGDDGNIVLNIMPTTKQLKADEASRVFNVLTSLSCDDVAAEVARP